MHPRRVVILLGSAVLVGAACSEYTGTAIEPADAGPDVSTSGSSGLASSSGSTSSTSSSSGTVVLDADVTEGGSDPGACTPFAVDATSFSCSTPEHCLGSAAVGASGIYLTTTSASGEHRSGAYWRGLGLSPRRAFTVTADLEILQPTNGPPGHGVALALVHSESEDRMVPPLATNTVGTMGVGRLPGFRGTAAYVKTYDSGIRGALNLRTTAIPSAAADEVDNWNTALNGSTFEGGNRTFIRIVLVNRPPSRARVQLLRMPNESFTSGSNIDEIELSIESQEPLDYLGVTGVRGEDGYSTSGHRLRALSLTCD